jgi:predicted solute-binding protein
VTEVDPALTTYEKRSGNVALRSLLTDGSAFCAFLQRDRDIDSALVSVAVGARQVESQTRLPLSVTTFNAVDSVALLSLCPSLQPLVPSSDLARIRKLGAALATPTH